MESVVRNVRIIILLLCVALFAAGALWNLCNPPQTQEAGLDNTVSEPDAQETQVILLQSAQDTEKLQEQEAAQALEHKLASLRIRRDSSWQQLYQAVEQLEFEEKQQKLRQYAELQYKEQRLELLIGAKGIDACIAVLEPEQANIIVPEKVLQTDYAKLYDLVLRNTDYEEEQIILVPLK